MDAADAIDAVLAMEKLASDHNAQVWEEEIARMVCTKCGEETYMPRGHEACGYCDWNDVGVYPTGDMAWWWWTCCPGCLPDSSVMGPFQTRTDALINATDGLED